AFEVPVELHLHAAVLVAMDLLARWAGHPRRLDAVHARLRRAPRRTKDLIARHALEADAPLVARGEGERVLHPVLAELVEAEREIEARDDVLAGGARVIEQLEAARGLDREHVRRGRRAAP